MFLFLELVFVVLVVTTAVVAAAVAAVEVKFELLAAGGALGKAGVNIFPVKINGFAASRALDFIDIVVFVVALVVIDILFEFVEVFVHSVEPVSYTHLTLPTILRV